YCSFHGGPGGAGMSGTITVLAPQTTNRNTTNVNTSASAQDLQAQVQALLNKVQMLAAQLGGCKSVNGAVKVREVVASAVAERKGLCARELARRQIHTRLGYRR